MVPPRWPDEQGRPIHYLPVAAVRSGSVASASTTSAMWGATLRAETYVNWCGHAQEVIPFPLEDGRVTFVPVLGEAR
jgi:hypothetical protein